MVYATLYNTDEPPKLVFAQAPSQGAQPRAADKSSSGSSGAGNYQPGGGFPSLKVAPDVNALPGLPKANEGVNGLAAATLIVLLATGVVGVLTLAASNIIQLPHWAEKGKMGIVIAPVGAFVLALLGQLIGWGWSLGIG